MPMPSAQMVFLSDNCLNIKKPFATTCWECFKMCPHNAINEIKRIDPNKCTDCGICMAVCPSDGFVDRSVDEIKNHIFGGVGVSLSCPAAQPGVCEISCIGMFDRDAWTTLLLLSSTKEVCIHTGECAACEDLKACSQSVETLKEVLSQWTLPNNMKIEIVPWDGKTVSDKPGSEGEPPRGADVSVNTANASANKSVIHTIGELREQNKLKDKLKAMFTPILAEESYNIPRSRQWLLEALGLVPGKIPFQSYRINDKCTACGVCAHVCPQGAMTHIKDNGVERIIYQPYLCVHCQRCLKVCGPQAITGEDMALDERFIRGKILLQEVTPRLCAKCGRQIFHKLEPGLCIGCAREDPELKGILY